jgi:hypothetical protein
VTGEVSGSVTGEVSGNNVTDEDPGKSSWKKREFSNISKTGESLKVSMMCNVYFVVMEMRMPQCDINYLVLCYLLQASRESVQSLLEPQPPLVMPKTLKFDGGILMSPMKTGDLVKCHVYENAECAVADGPSLKFGMGDVFASSNIAFAILGFTSHDGRGLVHLMKQKPNKPKTADIESPMPVQELVAMLPNYETSNMLKEEADCVILARTLLAQFNTYTFHRPVSAVPAVPAVSAVSAVPAESESEQPRRRSKRGINPIKRIGQECQTRASPKPTPKATTTSTAAADLAKLSTSLKNAEQKHLKSEDTIGKLKHERTELKANVAAEKRDASKREALLMKENKTLALSLAHEVS